MLLSGQGLGHSPPGDQSSIQGIKQYHYLIPNKAKIARQRSRIFGFRLDKIWAKMICSSLEDKDRKFCFSWTQAACFPFSVSVQRLQLTPNQPRCMPVSCAFAIISNTALPWLTGAGQDRLLAEARISCLQPCGSKVAAMRSTWERDCQSMQFSALGVTVSWAYSEGGSGNRKLEGTWHDCELQAASTWDTHKPPLSWEPAWENSHSI